MKIESRNSLERRFLGYSLESNGLLQHLGQIYVPVSSDLPTLTLSEAHRAPYLTHPNIKKMHVDLRQLYFWAGLRHDVDDFFAQCLKC